MSGDVPCTGKAAQPATSFAVARMMGLETAAKLLGGQGPLAGAIGIHARSLRAKLTGERGISRGDLLLAAGALDARAARLADHARKLREEAA